MIAVKKMTQGFIVSFVFGTILTATMFFAFFPRESARGDLDVFAKCLKEEGVTMYGADWCPHCQNEKNAFGDSFKFVPYVECPDNPKLCIEKGINGYPTWILRDGKRLEGEQGIEKLSKESGCPLQKDLSRASAVL